MKKSLTEQWHELDELRYNARMCADLVPWRWMQWVMLRIAASCEKMQQEIMAEIRGMKNGTGT